MSNPAEQADTQEEHVQETEKSELTFADKVNDVVSKMTKDDTGHWIIPEGEEVSEEVEFAAMAEKRVRDTQAAFTKDRQKLKALEAEKSALLNQAVGNVELNLSAEQAEELDNLKFDDPEAWRKKMNKLERDAREERRKQLDEEIKKVSADTLDETEKETRKEQLQEFLKANPGFELNDDVIANDIPPRITNKLEKGDITFEEFLQECLDYTKTGKVIKQEGTPSNVNLSRVGGGGRPDGNAVNEDIVSSYKKEAY